MVTRQRYWCMSYNTKLVRDFDLPKTWDDLVKGSRFAGKKVAEAGAKARAAKAWNARWLAAGGAAPRKR